MWVAAPAPPIQYDLPPLRRVITYVNWLIGLILLGFLGMVWFWIWRPLPQTSGTVVAPISAEATITRDSLGVAHIRAASIEDALFLQGYVTAQDRMWQMDALRRLATGSLSEVIGQATLETDRESRRMRIRRVAEEHVRHLPPGDRSAIAAYARGVNRYIETHRNKLPVEFKVLRYEPRIWTIADSLAIGLQMYRDLTNSYRNDLARAALIGATGGNRALLQELYPPRSGMEIQPGSNAWALSGRHTASGRPLLANDPHLEFAIPSTWYAVQLEAPGLKVAGVSLPGVPAVIIGHNDQIAWGVTNLHFDVQDLYVERLDARSGQYLFAGKVERARLEQELIPVKDARPERLSLWVTRHGPVLSLPGAPALALRWTATEPGLFSFPFLQLNRARNWEEFRAALRRFSGPGQNFVYADTGGNIGYQCTGALPVRKNFDGRVPADGSSGQFEWNGYIPFDDLPSVFNPPSGYVISANQDPFPPGWKYNVSGDFDSGYRSRQIRDLLRSREGWKAEEMITVQKDVYSPFLHAIAREVVKAAERRPENSESFRNAVRLLREWNGQAEKSLAAPMIAALTYGRLRVAIGRRASPAGASWDTPFAPAVVERLVKTRPKEWFPDWDLVLAKSLSEAVDEGANTQSRNVAKWRHGVFIGLELKHPVISQLPFIGAYGNVGPAEMSGSNTTVKQTTRRLGPSMRFAADLANWNNSYLNLTVGQSGQVLSSHYKDQWNAYWAGRSFPMRWTGTTGDVLRVQPGR